MDAANDADFHADSNALLKVKNAFEWLVETEL